MPPKNVSKFIEEKTFGMKNKNKSSKVGKYVESLKTQAMSAGSQKEKRAMEEAKLVISKKQIEADKKADLALLFKTIQTTQKVPFGVDPKTILCQFFKNSNCLKGAKCKFSHDLDVERRIKKIDLYSDAREKVQGKDAKELDSMENWDQTKLEQVINRKMEDNNNKPTDIVCKFFLEAIDEQKYGWFWACPNGGNECKYRHALPPGYILKKKETGEERIKREEDEKDNAITIEDFLETERHNLGPNLTPINFETFMLWKKTRVAKQLNDFDAVKKQKAEAYKKLKAGMKSGMTFSGKELFDFNPEWAAGGQDDDGALEEYGRVLSDEEDEVDESEDELDDDQDDEEEQEGDSMNEGYGEDDDDIVVVDESMIEPDFDENELAGLDMDDSDEE